MLSLQKIFFRFFLCSLLLTAGCSYKIEIKQGDSRLLENLEEVKTGMSRQEITEIWGPPQDIVFLRSNSWFYIYKLRDSGFIGNTSILSIRLDFNNQQILEEINILKNDFTDEK